MTKQYQSESIKELSAALAKAQGGIKHAGKSAENPFFKSKYADLPAVIDAAKSALSANGLSVTQFTDIDENQNIVLITQLNHSAGEWMRGYYPVKPVKSDPQGLGSALTYARRYAYSAIVGVAATGEDDDGNLASGNHTKQEAKSVFGNAAMRKTFCDNVIKSFESCETIAELSTIMELNKAKFEEMRASGNEHDELGVEELAKRYKLRLVAIKENNNFEQMKSDTGGRK